MQGLNERVVITGMGILCALGDDYEQILAEMKRMNTGIANITRFNTEKFQCHIGAEIKDSHFKERFLDGQGQQFDECAQYAIVAIERALKDSELKQPMNERVGLALGTCNGGILSLEEQWTITELDSERTARYPYYQQGDDIATYFNMKGPVATLNTACAASGNAIGFAYDMVRGGYADIMIAGGSDPLSHTVYAGFNALRALNPEPVTPFGQRYGLSLGEGASFVVVESLSSALKRHAKIYGEILSYGMSNDAYHITATDPEGGGMQLAVEMALKRAAVDKEKIGYINAHGTGTKANDISELKGLRAVFGEKHLAEIPLSSSKAYFGHNLGAAAAIELTTSLYAIKNELLPATLHHEEIREGCEGANIIANDMMSSSPEVMLCNNSAFGGHNVSIVTKTKNIDFNETTLSQPSRRIGIVGMGQVSHLGTLQGEIREFVNLRNLNSDERNCTFSLKDYDASLYERRMNALCQYSIGAGDLAMKDAGWEIEDEQEKQIGLIYGTALGSTDSIGKYLGGIFEDGAEYASSIYFPFYVLNSTAGKMAQRLRLKGFSSSLSTGGNDGLMSVFYGYEMIRNGVHQKFLVGAGDEISDLSEKIRGAKGLQTSRYSMAEGSCCLALADLDGQDFKEGKVYAEIKGCGLSFKGSVDDYSALQNAVHTALQQANLQQEDIDLIFINSVGRPHELEAEQRVLKEMLFNKEIPILCLNDYWGYGESLSSIQHLSLAASLLYQKNNNVEQILSMPSSLRNSLVVSSSINGNNIAIVLSK